VGCQLIGVIQRVHSCDVSIGGKVTSGIQKGMLVFLGIEDGDNHDDIKYISHKIIKLRIFSDNHGRMNFSVENVGGSVMIVSQFTLCGDLKKGNRPSYINAMDADLAKKVYDSFIDYIKGCYSKIKSGTFQADMNINLINDGPVTLIIRSRN
jgi:D-tyrosyl-tRNA(Tyr) deacylase